jgi:hypothetical protein
MVLRWGDAEEDEDVLPENTETAPNEKGIITKTEYYHNAKGEAMKRTTKIQLVKVQTKVYAVRLMACCAVCMCKLAPTSRSAPLVLRAR